MTKELTKRRIPAPAKMTLAGEKTYRIAISACDIPNCSNDVYHSNSLAKGRRKRIEYVDRWVKPSPQPLITTTRVLKPVDLISKYGQNSCGRVTCLKLAGERMSGKILFGLDFICLNSFFKNEIEIGRGCHRCGSLRARSGRLTHVDEMVRGDVDTVTLRWRFLKKRR